MTSPKCHSNTYYHGGGGWWAAEFALKVNKELMLCGDSLGMCRKWRRMGAWTQLGGSLGAPKWVPIKNDQPPHPPRIAETPWDSPGQKVHPQCLFLQGKACPPVFFHRDRSEKAEGRGQRAGLAGLLRSKHGQGTGLRG